MCSGLRAIALVGGLSGLQEFKSGREGMQRPLWLLLTRYRCV